MPPRLDTLAKGHELPPSAFELSPEWVREYVAAVEDEAIGLLGPDLVPPMAVAALAVRALLERAALPPGAVHIGQEITFQRAVRAGERLSASARVVIRGERQGWVLMGIDLSVEGEGGPIMEGRATVTMPAAAEAPS
jgi:acyl dehydratase